MHYYSFVSVFKDYLYHCFISTHAWTDSFQVFETLILNWGFNDFSMFQED